MAQGAGMRAAVGTGRGHGVAPGGTPRREIPAAALAASTTLVLLLLIYFGSRGLKDFDSALIGYAVGSVFAIAALVYRYSLWIMRPPTWRYFKAGWTHFLSWRNFTRYSLLVPVALWRDIFGQTFILKRSPLRWVMHMSIFWGVLLSLAITFPLTFGWIRFSLVPPDHYQLHFMGFPMFTFPAEAGTGFALFHALDWTGILLVVGIAIALWRRLRDVGLLTVQLFGFDRYWAGPDRLFPVVGGQVLLVHLTHPPGHGGGLVALVTIRQVLSHRAAPRERGRNALPDGQSGCRALWPSGADGPVPALRCRLALAAIRGRPQGHAHGAQPELRPGGGSRLAAGVLPLL
jgi:hypothetical protein